MKKDSKKITYIVGAIMLIILTIMLIFFKERHEAMQQTKDYLAENYPTITYEIQKTSSSTNLVYYTRYHGYFKYAVTVQNMNTKETFKVFYDKKMKRLEDSLNIEKQEVYLKQNIILKVEKYVKEHFEAVRYVDVNY